VQSDYLPQGTVNRKVLVTLAAGKYLQLLEMSRITFINYAKKWNYDFVEVKESWDESRPYAWTKLLAIRDLLDKYDFVFYVDSDALILRDDIDIETMHHTDFAWPVGPVNGRICPSAGIMAIRSSESSKMLFDLAYGQTDLIYNGWWEQAALMRILQYEDPRDHERHWSEFNLDKLQIGITELDSSWNSTSQDFAGDPIIRHFAGDPFPVKLLLMAENILTPKSPHMSLKLTDKERLNAKTHYLNGRNEIFMLQVTWQDKIYRAMRRVWSKIWKTPRYKYK
jgi:hypothetical protein